ncbi:GNAT family N-acetyltransferase [Zhongshania sp.]|uniref:GNAT family N-acetyltransferase n=1 Tax=Zhongshania sp. TaxID=1971902 RepID=UPI0035645B67
MTMIKISPIRAHEDPAIAQIIVDVGAEFGAIGEGYGPSDAEVSCMSQYYLREQNAMYLVATVDGQIVGGCGIAPLADLERTCELKKLFLLPEARGLGIGKKLVMECLHFAKERGFSQCYLDTLANMTKAISLYEKLGFEHLDRQLGGTAHSGCDVWMMKNL